MAIWPTLRYKMECEVVGSNPPLTLTLTLTPRDDKVRSRVRSQWSSMVFKINLTLTLTLILTLTDLPAHVRLVSSRALAITLLEHVCCMAGEYYH